MIRIERDAVVVTLVQNGIPEIHRLQLPEVHDEDLDLLTHMRDCLRDGGREQGREHPRGPAWFNFFGQRLWRRLNPRVEHALASNGRARVLLEIAVEGPDRLGDVLARAPWELSRFPVGFGSDEPLGTSSRVAVSRLISVPDAVPDPDPVGAELRVLFIESTDGPALRGPRVRGAIERPGVRLTSWTATQTFNCIRTLEGGASFHDLTAERFDIIHILAHGREDNGRVSIRLDEATVLTPEDLARLVGGRCRVVILESCSSAGVFRELLSVGPFAVVAMLYDINIDHLVQFNHELYSHLLKGTALDIAVQEGRRALDREARISSCGAPVLYVRSTAPIDLRLDPERPLPTPGPQRQVVADATLGVEPRDELSPPSLAVLDRPRDSGAGSPAAIPLLELMARRLADG